jgi:hypothetical protein
LRRALVSVLLVASGLSVAGAVALPAATASASSTQTVTFSYTGAAQTWTVPADVTGSIGFTVTAGGGGGGSTDGTVAGGPGGGPAVVTGDLTNAAPGDIFTVIVGGGGAGGTQAAPTTSSPVTVIGGWGGSGSGGTVSAPGDAGFGAVDYGGAGGGMSALSSSTACASGTGSYCIVAGGGGGGGGGSGTSVAGAAGGGGNVVGSSGGTSPAIGNYQQYGWSFPAMGGGGGTGGAQGAVAAGGSTSTTVGDPGPTGTGGGGGGGAAGGGAGSGGFNQDSVYAGGGGGGGGGSYVDTTDTASSAVTTGPGGGSGGAGSSVSPGSAGANGQIIITYTLAVPPTITSSSTSTTFTEDGSGTYTFAATGTPTPTFGEAGALPAGVSFSSSGVLSGTPTQDGAYPITVTATNGFSPNATQAFTLYVDAPPSISEPSSSATTLAGQAMTPVDFTATGYPAPTFSTSSTLPTGVILSSSGVLSGTPTQGGSFPLTVSASNGVGSASSTSFTLTVDESPTITSATTSTFSVGTAASFTVQASGYPTPTLSLSSSSTLPSGVSFTPGANGTATISGTPASGTGGSYQLGISASSSAGSAAQTLNLVVDSKATFTSPATITLDAGASVSFQVTTTGGFPVPSLTATASSRTGTASTLPPGLTFTDQGNGTALLTGTVASTNEGDYYPAFVATSTAGVVTQDAELVVQAPGAAVSNCPTGDTCTGGSKSTPPAIVSKAATTFLEGSNGSYEIIATGTPAPTFTEAGALPGGVNLSSAGVLSGTPTAAGTFIFTVKAANSAGSVTQAFTLTVTAPPAPPSSGGGGTTTVTVSEPSPGPSSTPPQLGGGQAAGQGAGAGTVTFTEGTGGSFQIPVSGTPEPTCSLASGSLPPGLTLSKGCLVSGSPTGGGTYTFTVKASNASGSTTETLTLTVQPPKVVVVPPSGPDYHFVGVLSGSLRYRVSSPASLRGTRVATSGKVLQSLDSDFGFDGRGGLGRVHLVLQRDVRMLKVRRLVHGHQRLVVRRIASYAGVLVLVEPEHHGALVFRQFTGVSLRGRTAHAVAIGRLSVAKRVRVRVELHGRERLVWRTRQIERPLRFAFQVSPSTS